MLQYIRYALYVVAYTDGSICILCSLILAYVTNSLGYLSSIWKQYVSKKHLVCWLDMRENTMGGMKPETQIERYIQSAERWLWKVT